MFSHQLKPGTLLTVKLDATFTAAAKTCVDTGFHRTQHPEEGAMITYLFPVACTLEPHNEGHIVAGRPEVSNEL